jgi:hypothetical protein
MRKRIEWGAIDHGLRTNKPGAVFPAIPAKAGKAAPFNFPSAGKLSLFSNGYPS